MEGRKVSKHAVHKGELPFLCTPPPPNPCQATTPTTPHLTYLMTEGVAMLLVSRAAREVSNLRGKAGSVETRSCNCRAFKAVLTLGCNNRPGLSSVPQSLWVLMWTFQITPTGNIQCKKTARSCEGRSRPIRSL